MCYLWVVYLLLTIIHKLHISPLCTQQVFVEKRQSLQGKPMPTGSKLVPLPCGGQLITVEITNTLTIATFRNQYSLQQLLFLDDSSTSLFKTRHSLGRGSTRRRYPGEITGSLDTVVFCSNLHYVLCITLLLYRLLVPLY